MRANSEKNSSFDISLFLKRFESLRESVVYFSAYKRFNHRQKETEIEKKKDSECKARSLFNRRHKTQQPKIMRFTRP